MQFNVWEHIYFYIYAIFTVYPLNIVTFCIVLLAITDSYLTPLPSSTLELEI